TASERRSWAKLMAVMVETYYQGAERARPVSFAHHFRSTSSDPSLGRLRHRPVDGLLFPWMPGDRGEPGRGRPRGPRVSRASACRMRRALLLEAVPARTLRRSPMRLWALNLLDR